jgi:hypothetical protein
MSRDGGQPFQFWISLIHAIFPTTDSNRCDKGQWAKKSICPLKAVSYLEEGMEWEGNTPWMGVGATG